MDTSLDRQSRISGYRLVAFRDALRGFKRSRSVSHFVDMHRAFPLRRDGAIVFEECLDRGLINRETLQVTPRGEEIARTKPQHRTPYSEARQLLDMLLDSADALNEDPRGVHLIERIWLFGSMMFHEGTVGNIDLIIETARRPDYELDHKSQRRRLDELSIKFPERPVYFRNIYTMEDWVLNRTLFGIKRHPLFADAVLTSGHGAAQPQMPCQLIYERRRGGRVFDPIRFQKQTRHKSIEAPMSRLHAVEPAQAQMRPMNARWIAAFKKTGIVSPREIFRGWSSDAMRLFSPQSKGLRVWADGDLLEGLEWVPDAFKSGRLDGRSAIAILKQGKQNGTSVVLRRKMRQGPTDWVYEAGFSALESRPHGMPPEPETLPDIVAVAALIVAVDVERMVRRAADLAAQPRFHVHIVSPELDAHLRLHFDDALYALLKARTVRIEPPNWAGSPVAIFRTPPIDNNPAELAPCGAPALA